MVHKITDLLIPTTNVLWFDGEEFRPMEWPTFALPKQFFELQKKLQDAMERN